MKHFHFEKNKYGRELLMDIGSYNATISKLLGIQPPINTELKSSF